MPTKFAQRTDACGAGRQALKTSPVVLVGNDNVNSRLASAPLAVLTCTTCGGGVELVQGLRFYGIRSRSFLRGLGSFGLSLSLGASG
jgi:hypothetical protein